MPRNKSWKIMMNHAWLNDSTGDRFAISSPAGRPAVSRIEYDDENWWPADFINWSFRHWHGTFRFNSVSSQPQVNEGTHLTSLPTSHPETDSMGFSLRVWTLWYLLWRGLPNLQCPCRHPSWPVFQQRYPLKNPQQKSHGIRKIKHLGWMAIGMLISNPMLMGTWWVISYKL